MNFSLGYRYSWKFIRSALLLALLVIFVVTLADILFLIPGFRGASAALSFRADLLIAGFIWLLGMGIAGLIMRDHYRLTMLNARLDSLLKENYEVGRILVRRDMELSEANMRLMALDSNKSEFVSIAAHQLRTPLTGIRWALAMLLAEELGPLTMEQKGILEEGLKSAVRMIELINSLLNVARIEEGRFGIELKRQPLEPLLEAAIVRCQDNMAKKGITLERDPGISFPQLNLDAEKMAIVFDNLLDNAIKYTPVGGTIGIGAAIQNGKVRVTVRDSGIGIPEAQAQKLFEKFFRAENALRFQTSGNGLGLYVVRNILQKHGGDIEVKSQEGKGSSFTIVLPIPPA